MPETRTVTFNYTGSVQTWTVPNGVRQVTIDCYGAQGANGYFNVRSNPTQGGRGGRARGTFNVTPGEILYIYVGGQGLRVEGAASYNGGWNGGGRPGLRNVDGEYLYYGAGGGGASDVRRGGQSLNDRIIVAGGGGGAGTLLNNKAWSGVVSYLAGGHGGGLTGTNAGVYTGDPNFKIYGGEGGTQTAGGRRGRNRSDGPLDGSFGSGGRAGNGANSYGRGAGGGGWYGGGGGDEHGAGGGGSGYIHPSATNQLFETGVRSGHGLVIITYEVIPPLYVRVNGQIRESASVHVRVNGQLREVDRIWTRVNGQLREV